MRNSIITKVSLLLLTLTFILTLGACRRQVETPTVEAPDVLMRVVDGVVQYQVAGEDHWRNLLSVNDLRGQDADPAVSVRSASVNAQGELILRFTDGSTENLGVVRGMPGQPGQDALAVRRTAIDEFGQLLVFFTDNSFVNLGVVEGSIGVDGEQGLSAFELYQRANPFYSKTEDQWFFDVADGRISTASFYDVMTVADLQFVAANMPEVTSVQLQAEIPGNVVLTRPLNINFNGYDIKGNVTINSTDAVSVAFTDTFGGDKGVITGDLVLNIPNASLTNNVAVEGTVTIQAVANATYRGRANAGRIIFTGPGRLDLTAPFSNIPVDINTDKPVILQGTMDLVSIGAINADVLVTGSTIISQLINHANGARIRVTNNGRIDLLNHNASTNLEVESTASVVTPSGVGALTQGEVIFVTFNVNPTNASFVLRDAQGNIVQPISGRQYRLFANTDYFYSTDLFSYRPINGALFNGSTDNATISVTKQELLTVTSINGFNNTLTINFNQDVYVEDGGDYIPLVEAWGNVTASTILSWLLKEGPLSIGTYYDNPVDLDAFFSAAFGEAASVTSASIAKVLSPRSIQFRFDPNVITSTAITTQSAVEVLLPLNMQFFRLQNETPFFGETVTAVAIFGETNQTVTSNLRSLEQHSQVSLSALTAQINAIPTSSVFTLNNQAALVAARALYNELDANPLVGIEYLSPVVKQRLLDLEVFATALENAITPVAIALSNATGTAVSVRSIVTRVVNNSLFFIQDADDDSDDITGPGIAVFAPNYAFRITTLKPGDEVHVVGTRAEVNGLKQINTLTRLDILGSEVATPAAIEPISNLLSDSAALLGLQGQLVNLDEFLIVSRVNEGNLSITFTLRNLTNGLEIPLRYDSALPMSSALRTVLNNLQVGDVLNIDGMVLGWVNGPQLMVSSLSEFEKVEEIDSAKIEAYLGLQLPDSALLDITLPTTIVVGGWTLDIEWASSDEAALSTQGAVTLGNTLATITLTANVTATGVSTGAITDTFAYTVTLPALNTLPNVISAAVNTQVAFEGIVTQILSPNIVLVQANDNDGGILVWNEANNGRLSGLAIGDEILVIGVRQNVSNLHVVNLDSPVNKLQVLATGTAIMATPLDISVALDAARGQRVSLEDFFIQSIATSNNVTTLVLEHLTHGTITVEYNRLVPGNATNVAILNGLLVGDAISITDAALVLPVAGSTKATLYLSNTSEISRVTPSALHFEAFARRALNIPSNVFSNLTLISSFTQGNRTFNVTWASLDLEWMSNQGVITRPALGSGSESLILESALILNGETLTVLEHAVTVAQIEVLVTQYETGFEASEGFASSTSYNTTRLNQGSSPFTWTFFYGTASTTGNLFGAQSVQMRWYSSAPSNIGYAETNFTLDNLRQIQFNASSTDGNGVEVLVSTNGTDWTSIGVYELSGTQRQITIDTLLLEAVYVKFQMALPENPVSASRLIIDNVLFKTGETNFTSLLEREFEMPDEVLPDQRIPLVSSFVLFDGKTYDVTWSSSNTSIISVRGLVRQPEESTLNVTLTATITQNGDFVDSFDYVITVLGRPLTVSEARLRSSGTAVRVEGVVTNILTNLNAVIEDATGAIIIRLSSTQLARLSVGDRVIMAGNRGSFNTLERVVNQDANYVIEILESNVALPAVVDANGLDLTDNNVWRSLESQRVDLDDVIVVSVGSGSSFNVSLYLPLFDRNIIMRYESTLSDATLSSALSNLQPNDVISLRGMTVGWFSSNPQFAVTNVNQVVTGAGLSLDAFEAYLDNEDILNIPTNVGGDVILLSTLSLLGYNVDITWQSSDTSAIALDGTVNIPALGEPNVDVTLTATLEYAGTQRTIVFDVTVLAVQPNVTYVETFESAFSSGTTSYATSISFTDANGFSWTASGRQDVSGAIEGNSIMLGNAADNSFVRVQAIGGISSFSVQMVRAFTNSNIRTADLLVNGTVIASFTVNPTDSTVQTFTVSDINISGNVTIEIRSTSPGSRGAFHVDNFTWTTYED